MFESIIREVTEVLIYLPGILIGLTFHEYAHGRAAYMLGDDTAYQQGRLTLNPLPHIDWIGFFMLVIAHFGWAKPVQVNPLNFHKNISMKQGMMLVALAGPIMNISIAFIGVIIVKILYLQSPVLLSSMIQLLDYLIQINIMLAVFNLIPVPPLDGSKILVGLLPDIGARLTYSLEQYGTLILIIFIFTGLTGKIIWPIVNFLYNLLYSIVF